MKTSRVAPFLASAALPANAFTGRASFFDPGLGACGIVNGPNDRMVAVSTAYFKANRATICGSHITVTYQGKSVGVVITDYCPSCPGLYDLDLSAAAFRDLAPLSAGILYPVTWS